MEERLGYSVIRNFDYSQPFEEGVMNKGRKEHQSSHILSKTCLDVFLPSSDHQIATLNDKSVSRNTFKDGFADGKSGAASKSHLDSGADLGGKFWVNKSKDETAKERKLPANSNTRKHSESPASSNCNELTSSTNAGMMNSIDDDSARDRIMSGRRGKRPPPAPPPPLVVFAYGGGWRRGDKQTWRHYISRWDTSLGLAAIVGRDRFYSNVGESFASRGFPCAVLSYPLVPTPFPINLIEMGSSFLFSLAFTFLLTLLSSFVLDVALMTLSFQPLIPKLWNFLQTHSSFPAYWAMAAIIIISQLLTLAVIVSRELFLKRRKQFETKKFLWTDIIFVLTIMTSLMLYFYYLSYSKGFDDLTFSICGMIVFFVQFLVHEFQQMTTFNERSKMENLVADPKGQAESVALALRWLVDYGRSTGHFDPDSIILMGHSAGGHLVSLVTLAHHYLTDVGVSPRIIKGVITLSAVHDLKSISKGFPYHIYLKPAFGTNPTNWTRMSPIQYVKRSETEKSNYDSHLPPSSSSSSFSPTSTSPLPGRTPRTLHLRRSASSTQLLSAKSTSTSLPEHMANISTSASSPSSSSSASSSSPPPPSSPTPPSSSLSSSSSSSASSSSSSSLPLASSSSSSSKPSPPLPPPPPSLSSSSSSPPPPLPPPPPSSLPLASSSPPSTSSVPPPPPPSPQQHQPSSSSSSSSSSPPPSSSSSSSQSPPNRPHFLIISASKDFDFMIEDSGKMHSHLMSNGYVTKRTTFQGCNHFTMIKKFGCPWYWYWPGALLGRRVNNWNPSDGELMCWEFVQQFWNKE